MEHNTGEGRENRLGDLAIIAVEGRKRAGERVGDEPVVDLGSEIHADLDLVQQSAKEVEEGADVRFQKVPSDPLVNHVVMVQ